jgi:CheY-like chemotaxis protein
MPLPAFDKSPVQWLSAPNVLGRPPIKMNPSSLNNSPASSAHVILVVEDDPDIREPLVSFLQGEFPRCAVREATNGQEALAVLTALDRLPCLILLDLMMPIMTGLELLAVLMKDDVLGTIPVTVVSALDGAVDGARHRLHKPFSLESVYELVKRYCESATAMERARGKDEREALPMRR